MAVRRSRWAARSMAGLVAVAILVSGCTSGPEPAPAAGSEESAAPLEDNETVRVAEPVPEPLLLAVDERGTLGLELLVIAAGLEIGQDPVPESRFFPIDAPGALVASELRMYWNATSPVNQVLRVGVAWNCTTDQDCLDFDYAQGPSPLEYTADEYESQGGGPAAATGLRLFVFTPNRADLAGGVYATHPDDFHIVGSLTLMPIE